MFFTLLSWASWNFFFTVKIPSSCWHPKFSVNIQQKKKLQKMSEFRMYKTEGKFFQTTHVFCSISWGGEKKVQNQMRIALLSQLYNFCCDTTHFFGMLFRNTSGNGVWVVGLRKAGNQVNDQNICCQKALDKVLRTRPRTFPTQTCNGHAASAAPAGPVTCPPVTQYDRQRAVRLPDQCQASFSARLQNIPKGFVKARAWYLRSILVTQGSSFNRRGKRPSAAILVLT